MQVIAAGPLDIERGERAVGPGRAFPPS